MEPAPENAAILIASARRLLPSLDCLFGNQKPGSPNYCFFDTWETDEHGNGCPLPVCSEDPLLMQTV